MVGPRVLRPGIPSKSLIRSGTVRTHVEASGGGAGHGRRVRDGDGRAPSRGRDTNPTPLLDPKVRSADPSKRFTTLGSLSAPQKGATVGGTKSLRDDPVHRTRVSSLP